MLELFNVPWAQLTQKMPEIAEAGYDSLWVPPPAKGSSVFSVGYDLFDPFDLGGLNQNGTVATRWGTQAELIQMVATAHRFGIRVYFDNVMNHRAFTVPGYNANTPTNYYPGMIPQDFHIQTVGQYYQNWPGVQDYSNQWDVQNESLSGLIDIANEPGSLNLNFGTTLGSTTQKPVFIRQPAHPEYYMNPALPSIGGPWHPFDGANGVPVAEDVNAYLIRAAIWTLATTKGDGFRLDAVKHTPSGFFGSDAASPMVDESTFSGYTGAIQAMYDYIHGYGNNVTGNGYVETDGNRNSLFDTEAPRNDAMLFGEHLGSPPSFSEYLNRGMRLLNAPLQSWMNGALGGGSSLSGMDGRDFSVNGGFSQVQAVDFAQSQDQSSCCATHRDLQNAYYFMHEGLPEIYSDGYNQSTAPAGQFPFPNVAGANYLGEFGDNQMPEIATLHHQLARGGSRGRWSDQNVVAFERYDYRDVAPPAQYGTAYTNADATVVLFAMNDNYGFPGDIFFDDGVTRTSDGYYTPGTVSNTRGCGLGVQFPPGSVLSQLASTTPGASRAFPKLLVHYATTDRQAAINSANDPNPVNRLVYVNTAPPPGGGAIEFMIPSGGWVMYGYQWPEASRAGQHDAIQLMQGGVEAPRITVYRQDGRNGDTSFNPVYPFRMRGSIDPYGNVIGGSNVSNRTYAIDIPVLTNGNFDILIRSDASASNALVKLDGGIDLNSQMGLGPQAGSDLRDNRPGYASDVFLGYEASTLLLRDGPEKFASRDIQSNNVVSLGAETYYYTVGANAPTQVPGSGYGASITNQAASWVLHDPTNSVTSLGSGVPATQRSPLNPAAGAAADVWIKVGYQFQINTCYLYYTTDGSNPEGSFGTGKGTTQVVQGTWVNHDSAQSTVDWWKATIPAQSAGVQVRYKVALLKGGAATGGNNIQPISDADGSKLYGLTVCAITNFNPATAKVWPHNDLSPVNVSTGLQSGFHILRARVFLPRAGKSGAFNTFVQTFYYDSGLPGGVIANPATDGTTLTNTSYTVVVRADSTVTGVDYNIQDSYGSGLSNGVPVYTAAASVTPNASLSAQYPSYPQEYQFSYPVVPTNGTATITVRLKNSVSGLYTNRVTTLTRTVQTQGAAQVLYIGSPATDGQVLAIDSSTVYLVQTCFTPSLTSSDTSLFTITINGVPQPQSQYFLRAPGSFPGCPGYRQLLYNWTGAVPGTNIIQVTFTSGNITLSDTRYIIVPPPLAITGYPTSDNQLIAWDSTPGLNYIVLSTTNLAQPFVQISPTVPATGLSTFYYDTTPAAPQKFYEVQVAP
ncbi:MAG: alpha-amylase family glycosyl hydrolase [Verrucomicrobiota bacterium]